MKSRNAVFIATLLAVTPSLSASAQEAIKIGSSLGLTGYGSLTDGHWRDGLETRDRRGQRQRRRAR